MGINIGNIGDVQKIYAGSTEVQKVYAGSTLVWENIASFIKLTYQIDVADTTITIPNGSNNNFTIDWGDGNQETYTGTAQLTHNYVNTGTYDVIIKGSIDELNYTNTTGNKEKITHAVLGGKIKTLNYFNFDGCTGLIDVSFEEFDTSEITNFSRMFSDNSALTGITGMDNFNTSSVTDMSYMFYYCDVIETLSGLDNWDVSNVTDMSYMFRNSVLLTTVGNLNNWNVSNVTDMKYMFRRCDSLTSLTLTNWNTIKVTDMTQMFYSDDKLTSIGDLSGWNVSSVTILENMFNGCIGLTTIGDISSWNVSNITNVNSVFKDCNQITDAAPDWWNTQSQMTDHTDAFLNNTARSNYNDIPQEWGGPEPVEAHIQFTYTITSDGTDVKLPTAGGDTSNNFTIDWGDGIQDTITDGTDAVHTYTTAGTYNAKITGTIPNIDFYNGNKTNHGLITEINGTGDIGLEYLSLALCENAETINLEDLDVSRLTTLYFIFAGLYHTQTINVKNWNTSNVTNMGLMFYYCYDLTNIIGLETWDTSNATTMEKAFYNSYSFTTLNGIENWDVSNVTSMLWMFYKCNALESLNLNNWNFSSVTTMEKMFMECYELTTVGDMSLWNVSNVTSVWLLFGHDTKITDPALDWWNTQSQITSHSDCFYNNTSRPNYDDIPTDWK